MKTITAKEFYAGYDPGTEHDFTLEEGESIAVSDEKFEQLERDGLLERFDVGKAAAKSGAKSDEPDGDLDALKRPELNKLAAEIGIEDPDKLKTVDDVRSAIKSARHGVDGEQAAAK